MSLIAEVVAALNAARKTADDTRLTVTQVAGHAERSAQLYTHAAQGTNHPQAQAAVTQMQAAQHRTNLIIAQISKGVAAIDEYIRDIAPALAGGGGGGQAPAPASGKTIAEESDRSSRAARFFRESVKKGDDVTDMGKVVADLGHKGVQTLRELRPPGPTHSGTIHRPPQVGSPTSDGPSAGDIGTGIVAALIVVGVTAHSLTRAAKEYIRKARQKDE